jgi:hypothetical protein
MFEGIPVQRTPTEELPPQAEQVAQTERSFEKRVSADHLIERLVSAVQKMKEGRANPGSPEWFKSMAQSIELIQNGEPIGHLGNEDIYATGERPLCTVLEVLDTDGNAAGSTWKLENAVTVSNFGTRNEVVLTSPPHGWEEDAGSNGQVYSPPQ